MNLLDINGLRIGEGMPKICVPIVADNLEEAVRQAKEADSSVADIVELRIDYFEKCNEEAFITEVINTVKKNMNKPMILTYRTDFEGGSCHIEREDYAELLINILEKCEPEILDVELFTGDSLVTKIVATANKKNVKIIMSNHDFDKTPEQSEIVNRLKKMQELNADIAKIAVMPNSKLDVTSLLNATVIAGNELDIPVVTMSMSGKGLISRLMGEQVGSAITFGAVKEASAPGQINAAELKKVLEIVHANM